MIDELTDFEQALIEVLDEGLVAIQQRDAEIQLGVSPDDLIERLWHTNCDDSCGAVRSEAADALASLRADQAHWKAIAQIHNDLLVERIKEAAALRAELGECIEQRQANFILCGELRAENAQCRAHIGVMGAENERLMEEFEVWSEDQRAKLRARIAVLEALTKECADAMEAADKYESGCLPDYGLIARARSALTPRSTTPTDDRSTQ